MKLIYVVAIQIAIALFLITGEVMCIYKCINSDWEPSYRREIIYGVSALSGLGGIVGYLNIPDSK